nr:5-hydroxytryptamine receptor 1B-like [Pocillopora verrucosa]
MILTLVGNLLLIYIVWNTPETRGLTSFLFVNMAVADLLVAVIQMPLSMAHFYSTGMTGVAGDLFFCWLPMQVLQMDYVVTARIKWHPAAIYFASWLSQANSAINPWLYILLNGKMNGAFRRMIGSQSVRSRAFSNTSQSTTAVSFLRNDCLEDTAV